MTYVMVDIEADGRYPGDFSMIALGAVIVEAPLMRSFLGQLKPISDEWNAEALAVSGFSRDETMKFDEAKIVMEHFAAWLKAIVKGQPVFVSDNNGFDWQFVNYYFWRFTGGNPFGHSSMNLGSLYKGLVKDTGKNFKHLRKTKHTHNPVDDATGNAEALLAMQATGLKIGV